MMGSALPGRSLAPLGWETAQYGQREDGVLVWSTPAIPAQAREVTLAKRKARKGRAS